MDKRVRLVARRGPMVAHDFTDTSFLLPRRTCRGALFEENPSVMLFLRISQVVMNPARQVFVDSIVKRNQLESEIFFMASDRHRGRYNIFTFCRTAHHGTQKNVPCTRYFSNTHIIQYHPKLCPRRGVLTSRPYTIGAGSRKLSNNNKYNTQTNLCLS